MSANLNYFHYIRGLYFCFDMKLKLLTILCAVAAVGCATHTSGRIAAGNVSDGTPAVAGPDLCEVTSDTLSRTDTTRLVLCGSNMAYIIDAGLVEDGGSYKDAVLWSWDARTAAQDLGLPVSRMSYLADCKPVDNGERLLVISSTGWCVLLDVKTKEVLFYSTSCPMAHSAAMLPGGRIAVACSVGKTDAHNSVQLYDVSESDRVLDSHELHSAHGVVWNDAKHRLYALGFNEIQVYKLKHWHSSSPKLTLEKIIHVPRLHCHDLGYVNAGTMSVAGESAYLYSIDSGEWTEMPLFMASTSIKSLNLNPENGEMWYTDATHPEGEFSWSTQTLCHAGGMDAAAPDKIIKVPDINCYKVRVFNW